MQPPPVVEPDIPPVVQELQETIRTLTSEAVDVALRDALLKLQLRIDGDESEASTSRQISEYLNPPPAPAAPKKKR